MQESYSCDNFRDQRPQQQIHQLLMCLRIRVHLKTAFALKSIKIFYKRLIIHLVISIIFLGEFIYHSILLKIVKKIKQSSRIYGRIQIQIHHFVNKNGKVTQFNFFLLLDHIKILCQIISNRPDIVSSVKKEWRCDVQYMKKTFLYQKIDKYYPGMLSKILNPDRLRLLSNPEMIKSLISMDQAVEKIRNQRSLQCDVFS